MKFSKIFSVCFAAGLFLSGCSLFSGDTAAPVVLPIYEVTPKAEYAPFFVSVEQVEAVADLLEVDPAAVQEAVDESFARLDDYPTQIVRIRISCDLPVEASLAAATFLHPGYVWESLWVEELGWHRFGIDLAPGFDEVANTATASLPVTGAVWSGIDVSPESDLGGDAACDFFMENFRNDFEVVGYAEVSRSAGDARKDAERINDLLPLADGVDWDDARISYLRSPMSRVDEEGSFDFSKDSPGPYVVYPVFYAGKAAGVFASDFVFAPVDPSVAAAEIRFLESQEN